MRRRPRVTNRAEKNRGRRRPLYFCDGVPDTARLSRPARLAPLVWAGLDIAPGMGNCGSRAAYTRYDAPRRVLLCAPTVIVRQTVWGSRVAITPSPDMVMPVSTLWTNVATKSAFAPSQASNGADWIVPPGEYVVKCADARGYESAYVAFRVDRIDVPIVRAYCTQPATCDDARDGRVVAVVENLPRDSGSRVTFQWSTGHVTHTPVLEGVRPGRYTALVTAVDGEPVMCMHAATDVAVVGVATDDGEPGA